MQLNIYYEHLSHPYRRIGTGSRFPALCMPSCPGMDINGWVSNGNDGVHIEFNATKEQADIFIPG